MQSMFRLPWSTESPADKLMEKAALHKPRALATVPLLTHVYVNEKETEVPAVLAHVKRKRTASPEVAAASCAHVVKKWKDAHGQVQPVMSNSEMTRLYHRKSSLHAPQPPVGIQQPLTCASTGAPRPHTEVEETVSSVPAMSDKLPSSTAAPSPKVAPSTDAGTVSLQQAIEAQINYEILLKHNELRLIEQELAKCQISLEQLRRCSLIPFPGSEGLSELVSGGVGPALQPPSGFTTPQYAAPWGVTDGPYTRHYAKWLISDAKFDSMSERALAQQSQGYFGASEGRTTRHSLADLGSAGKARTSRTSTGTLKLQALGENPAPAPKVDPLLHKRSTDGQWVRLYCAQCGHSNFSNTQGFLNHCRIKHNQVFKSHDQAACACGVPVDVDEVGHPVTATEPATTPVSTPTVAFPTPTVPGSVHPLIRSNPAQLAKHVHRDFTQTHEPKLPISSAGQAPSAKSTSTPHLASLLQKRGFHGNLSAMVDSALSKVDVEAMDLDDDLVETAPPSPTAPLHQLARLPSGNAKATSTSQVMAARLGNKGRSTSHTHLPLTLPARATHRLSQSPVELSPHAVESNPGLVSDHDDDDDDDHDDARSQPDFIVDDNVLVEDASDMDGVHDRTASCAGLGGCFQKREENRQH